VNWDKAWADAVEANEQISSNKDKWLDFWNQYSEQYSIEVKAERQLHLKVLSYLEREGWLRRGDGVIDIGCGPGTYALLLAEHARWVTCLDSSEGMLDKVKEEAIKAGIMNINLWLDRWEDARPKVKYDLAICARSPAIKDRCGLLKMEEMSSRDCCFIAGVSKEEDKDWKALWEFAVGPAHACLKGKVDYNVINPLNILLEEKRNPDLKFIYETVEISLDEDMLVENSLRNFRIYTTLTTEKEQAIKDRILSWCNDGYYEFKRKKGVAIITWKAPEV